MVCMETWLLQNIEKALKIMTHFLMVLGMIKMRTRCKHSVADAVSMQLASVCGWGYETAHSMGVAPDIVILAGRHCMVTPLQPPKSPLDVSLCGSMGLTHYFHGKKGALTIFLVLYRGASKTFHDDFFFFFFFFFFFCIRPPPLVAVNGPSSWWVSPFKLKI